jgi:riboflavin synthase
MFTGIVEATGDIVSQEPAGDGIRLRVDAHELDLADVAVGDSISVSGCCLTVVAFDEATLEFDVSAETLRCTAGFDAGRRVNLEKALRLADRLGGHLMTGHVDGVGVVAARVPVGGDGHGSAHIAIDAPPTLARYIAQKGSVAVDGVSLTVNTVDGARFTVNLIPHTLVVTTLGQLATGARVNLEVDVIARYLERLRATPSDSNDEPGNGPAKLP